MVSGRRRAFHGYDVREEGREGFDIPRDHEVFGRLGRSALQSLLRGGHCPLLSVIELSIHPRPSCNCCKQQDTRADPPLVFLFSGCQQQKKPLFACLGLHAHLHALIYLCMGRLERSGNSGTITACRAPFSSSAPQPMSLPTRCRYPPRKSSSTSQSPSATLA